MVATEAAQAADTLAIIDAAREAVLFVVLIMVGGEDRAKCAVKKSL